MEINQKTTFEEVLERDGVLPYTTKGISMQPMLHEAQDLVIIEALRERPRRLDVILYRRGGEYVLHRIVRVRREDFVVFGDNTYVPELVPDEDVLGVLTSFVRKGREHRVTEWQYRVYAEVWTQLYPLRALCVKLLRRIRGYCAGINERRRPPDGSDR